MIPALVVVRPFATYDPGAIITDLREMARVLGDERTANVVRVALPGVAATEKPSTAPASAAKAADQPAKEA